MIDFQSSHMIPDLYILNESDVCCCCCCCCCMECFCRYCVQNMAYCFLFCSYFVCPPQQEEITGCWLRTIVKPCMDITSCNWPAGEYKVQPLLCIISKVMWSPWPAESEECHCHPDTWQCSPCLKRYVQQLLWMISKLSKVVITAICILFFRDISQKKEVSSVMFHFMLLCPAT